jgi:hypothetical protein
MNLNEIKEWLITRLETKGRRSMMISIRNSITIQNILKSYTRFLPENVPHTQRAWHIINDVYEISKCKECGINETNYSHRCESWGYLEFCSTSCASLNEDTQNKVKKTSLERFGATNIFSTLRFREKYIKRMLENYGVVHNWLSEKSLKRKDETRKRKKIEWLKTLPDRQLYYETVMMITNKQLYHFGIIKFGDKWWEKRGVVDHHIDHMYSIKRGFENNVPPYIIGSIHNLDLIPYKQNVRKQCNCSKSIDEVLSEIQNVNNFQNTLTYN